MLEAIRNLGILKMIQEFPDDFTYEALESVDKFLEQREKAIQKGIYGRLQFETIDDEEIGVFSINGDELSFKTMGKTGDTSQYIFRKTPGSQAAYISPTWKAAKSNKKLESSVEDFKRYLETKDLSKETKQVFEQIASVFESKSISVTEVSGTVVMKIPLKQGLKHIYAASNVVHDKNVVMKIPLKQGLKQQAYQFLHALPVSYFLPPPEKDKKKDRRNNRRNCPEQEGRLRAFHIP